MVSLAKNYVIRFQSELSRTKEFRLLVDTGATCSLIDVDSLRPDVMVYPGEATIIKGLIPETQRALGVCRGMVELNGVAHECVFQVVKNMNGIPGHGILGQDFFGRRTVIDCVRGELQFHRLGGAVERVGCGWESDGERG